MILDYIKRCEKSMLISTAFTFVLGMVLTFAPGKSIRVITGVIATFFVLIGVLQLIEYLRQSRLEKVTSLSLVLGILLCGIGTFLFINLESLVSFITTLIGITIIIKAIFKLQFALNVRALSDKWIYNLVIGLACLILGILLLVNPFKSAELFLRIIGILLAIGSILELIETFMVLHSLNEVKDDAIELQFEEKKKKGKKETSE